MNTKKALAMLSKGAKIYETHGLGQTLADKSAEYLEQYAAADVRVLTQQQAEDMAMPFLESLRKKVSTLVSAPDESLPVVTRFDLYTGIRKMSERSVRDAGLKRLTAQLERAWHQDPVGGLTYGQVKALVRSFKDDFPRSNAADAIEAECARVGLHKLPVAKLARIASKINSQADYEAVIKSNNLDGDRAEQVRSRTLVRSLVSMRSTKTADERIAAKIVADGNAMPGSSDLEFSHKLLEDASGLAEKINQALDQASMQAFSDGLEDAGQKLQDLSSQLGQWLGGLSEVRDSMQLGPDPVSAPAKPSESPVSDGPEEGPAEEAPELLSEPPLLGGNPKRQSPPKPSKPLRGPENDAEDAGIGKKKLLDPRTWFASKGVETIRLAKAASKAADMFEEGEMTESLNKFSELLAAITGQLAPVPDMKPKGPPGAPPDMDMPLDEALPGEGMEPPIDMGDGTVQAPELDQGMSLLQEIEQAADEIIQDAPPQAVDYIQHEMGEGHLAPPGTAEWGAEEILNEGHEYAPPTEGWLQEEEQELGLNPGGGEMPLPTDNLGAPPAAPKMPMSPPGMGMGATMKFSPERALAAAKMEKSKSSNGIPLPKGKIKQQQEVTTYAKKVSPDGGKTLKASDIEAKLLDGKTLKMGHVVIKINANDEVELWDREAGRACSLLDLDIAIADFMNMTGLSKGAQAAPAAPAKPAGPPAPPAGPAGDIGSMPPAEVIKAGLTHYKSLGMGPTEAIQQMLKDYKEREDLRTPENQMMALSIATSLWSSGAPAPAAPGAAAAPEPMSNPIASVHEAEGKMKTPSIRKPKDHVSVPKDLGEDSDGKDLLPSPGKIKQQQGKPQGNFAPKELGEDSGGKDLLPNPGKPSSTHSPTENAGTKLPDKNFLGSDSESADPFKTPGLGSSPSPRKK